MANRRLDHTGLGKSNIKSEQESSTKRERLTLGSSGPKKAKKSSQKMIHQHVSNHLEEKDEEASEPTFKLEEALLSPEEHENKSLRARIPVTEGLKYQGREDIKSFKTLEGGLIYFFYRSRVDVLGPCGINDVARSFIVLRPTPSEAASIQSDGSTEFGTEFRLLVVPKKVFPTSGRIKEMGFVERAGITLEELEKTLIAGEEYNTKTYGTRTTPDATLFAKGVYTITSTQRNSHLSYILTNPKTLGPVQEDFGLHAQGSWVVQSKNPKLSSPSYVSLPKGPDCPESFGEIFGFYRWVPLKPELIDYPNAQILLIGRSRKEAFSVVPEGRREDRMRADQELEEMARRNDEREKDFRGNHSLNLRDH
ncbi:BTB domain transcription factor [Penicillium cosmopolitanum]|uniref:BTB domain transcription factor n=1 Tax=Penicillium cosmopolitanum TaxID=1131564 RepID=A0A9W9WA66_9EURO|nr:BTB domain transcription factor [Penicillium cosmopolitanum]KAJ5413617.1 BTB domain transcription factor [Penicillium cosmopolitanum]